MPGALPPSQNLRNVAN
jgi:hypothetical protein